MPNGVVIKCDCLNTYAFDIQLLANMKEEIHIRRTISRLVILSQNLLTISFCKTRNCQRIKNVKSPLSLSADEPMRRYRYSLYKAADNGPTSHHRLRAHMTLQFTRIVPNICPEISRIGAAKI